MVSKSPLFNFPAKDAYPADGSDEDQLFAKFSPAGALSLPVANPALLGILAPDPDHEQQVIHKFCRPPAVATDVLSLNPEPVAHRLDAAGERDFLSRHSFGRVLQFCKYGRGITGYV